MAVSLLNDGPVTIILEKQPKTLDTKQLYEYNRKKQKAEAKEGIWFYKQHSH